MSTKDFTKEHKEAHCDLCAFIVFFVVSPDNSEKKT
jgi:hypothetical protein